MVNNYIVLYCIEQDVLIQRNVSTQEEDDYSTLVCLMYYLSIMKRDGFNPEKRFRLKFHCNKWEALPHNSINPNSWNWWFGIDSKSIRKTLLLGESRGQLMENYIKKYFEYNESEKKFYHCLCKDLISKNVIRNKIAKDRINSVKRRLSIEFIII